MVLVRHGDAIHNISVDVAAAPARNIIQNIKNVVAAPLQLNLRLDDHDGDDDADADADADAPDQVEPELSVCRCVAIGG